MKSVTKKTKSKNSKASLTTDQRSTAIFHSLNSIQGKYKVALIARMTSGRKRMNKLIEEIPGATIRPLTTELRELEESGLIKKYEIGTMPVIAEYELTEEGHIMNKILEEIYSLAQKGK